MMMYLGPLKRIAHWTWVKIRWAVLFSSLKYNGSWPLSFILQRHLHTFRSQRFSQEELRKFLNTNGKLLEAFTAHLLILTPPSSL
jgi:hypothetical protein